MWRNGLSFATCGSTNEEPRWVVYECGSRMDAIADMSRDTYSILAGRYLLLQGFGGGRNISKNQCWLLNAERPRATRQDKLSLTPLERREAGGLPFMVKRIHCWSGMVLRIAMIFCLR